MSESNGNGQLLPPKRSYHLPRLSEMQSLTPAPNGVGAWAEKLREAAYDAVKEADVQELIKSLMEKAKAGDLKAAKFVMDFLTGGAPKVQMQTVIVHKRTKTTQRQAPPPAKGERHSPDLDELMEARPRPAALDASPSVKVLRRLAALSLNANGPSPGPALAAQLEVTAEELETVLECDWFALKGGHWSLTPEGRQAI